MRKSLRSIVVLSVWALVAASEALAQDPTIPLRATLTPSAEVPPVTNSGGRGEAIFELDTVTRRLSWQVTYVGLTGAPIMAHLHGPADETANAPVVVPFPQLASPIEGSAMLSEPQMTDLLAGRWYVNIHTGANQSGEIRGQIGRP